MESNLKNFNDSFSLQDCDKTNICLTTPFSINDILPRVNESKCDFENGMFPAAFGGKINFFNKPGSYTKEDAYQRENTLEKNMKYYDDCNYKDFTDDGALDIRKTQFPVTELSG